MSLREEIYLNLLDRALEEELGLVVETSNPSRLSHLLHDYSKLDRYGSLAICVPSIPKELEAQHSRL